ncbi:MAG: hypothetical protein AAGC83_08205, partial [Pseudomonadota bacterium]
EKVDQSRISFAETLLQDCGVPKQHAPSRARLLYWAAIGRLMLPFPNKQTLTDEEVIQLADLIAARTP